MEKEINWIERRKRNYLKDVLPLDTPYTIILEPIRACNFKCIYCAYSTSKIEPYIMSLELFKKAIDGLSKFNNKLKTFQFIGLGEPLLNKDIYKMIDLIQDYAEIRTILTNGALLSESNIDKLLNTTLNEVRISLQGISEEDYYKNCGTKIDLKYFLSNLSYLYKNRGDKKIFLKIPDIAINTNEKKEKFYELFEDKCDHIIFQKISPLQNPVNYSDIISDFSKTQYFEEVHRIKVCHQPFMMMQILANGDVAPCCALDIYKPIIGNINNEDIYDIWNGNEMKKFRLMMLEEKRNTIKACEQCGYPEYQYNKYDDIDNYNKELLKKYI